MARRTKLLTARVTPEFKHALRLAAAREHRSQTNLLEWLVLEYCREHGISADRSTIRDRVSSDAEGQP